MIDPCLQLVIEASPVVDVIRHATRGLANLEKRRGQLREELRKKHRFSDSADVGEQARCSEEPKALVRQRGHKTISHRNGLLIEDRDR